MSVPRPVPGLRTTVRRPGTGLPPSSPFASTFEVREDFGLHIIPPRIYLTAIGCRSWSSPGNGGRECRDDQHAPDSERPTGEKSPLGEGREKRNFLSGDFQK